MAVTPADGTGDRSTLARQVEELRTALQQAAVLVAFEAGQAAADDPERAERLLAAADGMQDVVARTAPAVP